ncbi:MAG: DUF2442 domain-containing protein [Desulfamplus sp.]
MKSIKKICSIKPYQLTLEFDDNEIKLVDLETNFKEWSKSNNSKFRELLNPLEFNKVKLNQEIESIYWDNGIDLCPDVLYSIGKNVKR